MFSWFLTSLLSTTLPPSPDAPAPATVSVVPATVNGPHGCPNYGLCDNVTLTLVSETATDIIYQYGCLPEDCVCVSGTNTTTNNCDTIVDKCATNPCGNSSTQHFDCTPSINDYSCACTAGWTGSKCDSSLDSACATAACQNGATCNSTGPDTYSCKCKNGYTGDFCEIVNKCYNVNCNNGNCTTVLENSNFYCQCKTGYQGRYCDLVDAIITLPDKDGCYQYDYTTIGAATTKFSDNQMTVGKCSDYANTFTPAMGYMTLCGVWCIVTENPILNNTASASESDCKKTCGGNGTELCGRLNSRCIVYTPGDEENDPNPCLNTTLCNADIGSGVCVNLASSNGKGYQCLCGAFFNGNECENPIPNACDPSPCVNGTCILNSQFNTQTCLCDDGFTGDDCEFEETCTSSTCLYGGTCEEKSNGDYECHCLNLYYGDNCENIDRCKYQNPCVKGKCASTIDGVNPVYNCTCDLGYTGQNCDSMINFCEPNPCQYNSTCNPMFLGYNCSCLTGLQGKNCSDIIDLCVGKWVDGSWIKTPCNTKDNAANCTKGINTFTCSCSDKWTNTLCDLNILIKDVLMAIYGYVDLNMITLLNDLMSNPSVIKDMVPFITGLLSDAERSDLSWDVTDLFHWIAFEDKRLDLNTDIYKWNDVVLGNCFTFNHRVHNFTYLMRSPGRHGGILAFMKTQQAEYAPWYDTSAMNVFIHNKDDYVFSESVRYNAQPNAQSTINIFSTRYTRLGGQYGKCIKKTSEVKAYYYPGSYTTDGCLRTCYQDAIMKSCSCMDPRYPTDGKSPSCQLSERSCVTEASESAGDPSTWKSCVCPLPCSNQEYTVTWSKSDFVEMPVSCTTASDIPGCLEDYKDNLLISIVLPQLDYKIYSETPAMDFNKFLSQLGGQLGVLMGINLVSFIEVVFLCFGLVMMNGKERIKIHIRDYAAFVLSHAIPMIMFLYANWYINGTNERSFLKSPTTWLAIILYISYIIISFNNRRKNYPPGPPPMLVFGNAPFINMTKPEKTFLSYREIYGEVFTLHLPNPTIILADYKSIQETLGNSATAGRSSNESFVLFTNDRENGDGLILSMGHKWRNMRQEVTKFFKSYNNRMESLILYHTRSLEAELKKAADSKSLIDVTEPLAGAIANVIQQITIGKTFSFRDEEFQTQLRNINNVVKEIMTAEVFFVNSYPWLRFLPDGILRKWTNYKQSGFRLQEWFRTLLKEHLANEHQEDFMSHMVERQETGTEMFNDLSIILTCGDIWTGGMETTVTTLRWGLIYLLRNPEIQQRCHEEIVRVFGDREPTVKEFKKTPYVRAVVSEIQRVANVLPWAIPHKATSDVKIRNFSIKKGTEIIPALGAVLADPNVFEEPEVFRPERFLDENENYKVIEQFRPFGIGQRVCLGEQIAKDELYLIFCRLMQNFRFFVQKDEPLPTAERVVGGITNPPKKYETRVEYFGN